MLVSFVFQRVYQATYPRIARTTGMKVFIFAVDVLNLRLFDQMRWFGWNDELSWRKTAGLLCSFWTTAWTFCCGILTSLYLKTDRKMFRYEVYAFYFSLQQ